MNNHEQIDYKRLRFNPIMFYTLHRLLFFFGYKRHSYPNLKYDVLTAQLSIMKTKKRCKIITEKKLQCVGSLRE